MATRIFTTIMRSAYLKVLSQTGNRQLACEACNIKPRFIKDLEARDEDFAAEVAEAKEQAKERLEGEAYRRAVIGVEEPVFQGGIRVGTVRKYSDGLLGKLLEANDPRFSSRVRMTGEKGGPIEVKHDLANLSDEELHALETLISKSSRPGDGQG